MYSSNYTYFGQKTIENSSLVKGIGGGDFLSLSNTSGHRNLDIFSFQCTNCSSKATKNL